MVSCTAEHDANRIQNQRIRWRATRGGPRHCDRFIPAIERNQTARGLCLGFAGRIAGLNGPVKKFECFGKVSVFRCQQAENYERFGIAGLGFQDAQAQRVAVAIGFFLHQNARLRQFEGQIIHSEF